MSNNPYSDAIACLSALRYKSQDDLFTVLTAICQTNPSVLVKACNAMNLNPVPGYLQQMDSLFASEGGPAKIKLIKMYRDATRVGLGDAKLFVEQRYNIGY